jgi:hypothetical protein
MRLKTESEKFGVKDRVMGFRYRFQGMVGLSPSSPLPIMDGFANDFVERG